MDFFITNREIIKDAEAEYIRADGLEHAGDNLRFGQYDNLSDTFILYEEPQTDADITYSDINTGPKEQLKGSAHFFRELYDQLCKDSGPKNDVLFFIHGFNTDLEGVRDNFKMLRRLYAEDPESPINHIIIFTWPGRCPVVPVHYFDDMKDAIRSGETLARGMQKVIRFFKEFLVNAGNIPCERKIHFMAHSMGHRVLKHMMLELKTNRTPLPDLFGEILLMAADIEYDIFELNDVFPHLIDLGKRVHVYFHHNDKVLDISKYTKNFSNRLGRYGRKRIDPLQVDVIDVNVTSIKEDINTNLKVSLLNHWYYYTSSEVVEDVINIMNGKKSAFEVSV
jgi:esterase/lipase superfamily enzyme